jgi:hypothetical protein
MNGPNEIRNINAQRSREALTGLQAKAELARKQNHPKAAELEAQAAALAKELNH